MTVIAEAHPNIALIKYWGKRDVDRNLPAVGSLSITLDGLTARTSVEADPQASADSLVINGVREPGPERRASRCLDRIRALSGRELPHLAVRSEVNFPVAAGLASSAAGFAALVVAADACFGTGLGQAALARLAGAASGSAARSLYGGFVRLHAPRSEQDEIRVETLAGANDWPLSVVIAVTDTARKSVGSTEAMLRCAATSAFYRSWVDAQEADLALAADAVASRDFSKLADVSEANCLRMHAVILSAVPGIVYWNGATVELIHTIRALRAAGTGVFFTIDAGPQVKAVCLPGHAAAVRDALQAVSGVVETLVTGLGGGARTVP